MPHVFGRQLVVLFCAVLANQDGHFVAGEFAAEFRFPGGDGGVALVGALGKTLQQLAGDADQFKAMLAAFDGITEVLHFAGQGVAVDLRKVARVFEDGRSFEREEAGIGAVLGDVEDKDMRM